MEQSYGMMVTDNKRKEKDQMKLIHIADVHWGAEPERDKPWGKERGKERKLPIKESRGEAPGFLVQSIQSRGISLVNLSIVIFGEI